MSQVPADVGVLLQQHGKFLPYVIKKVIPHHLREDELEDLQHDIYEGLLKRKYLDKCRRCEAKREAAGESYSFLASLRTFVERMAKNYLRNRHAMMRDPMLVSALPDVSSDPDAAPVVLPPTLRVEARQDDAALASARLQRIRQALSVGRRVIGGVPAVAIFDAAAAEDIDVLDKYQRRQLRRAVQESIHAAR